MGHIVRPLDSNHFQWRQVYISAAYILVWFLCSGGPALGQNIADLSNNGQISQTERTPARFSALAVQKSTQDVVGFGYEKLTPSWKQTTQGLQPAERFALIIPGFVSTGSPGSASVPSSGGWIVIPPGKTPKLSIVSEEWSSADGRPLAVVPVPFRVGEPALDDASFSELSILPNEDIPADLPFPPSVLDEFALRSQGRSGSAVQLGEIIWWRGRRIVSYTVVPVRYDGRAIATEVLDSGSWEVRFVEDKSVLAGSIPTHHAKKTSTRFDGEFGSGFLNQELLSGMPTESAFRGSGKFVQSAPAHLEKIRGQKSGSLKSAEVRIPVPATRLYRVTFEELTDSSLLPASVTVQESEIRMYQRRYLAELDDGSGQAPYAEIEVPIQMVSDGGSFSGDDFFIFYGLRSRDDLEFEMEIDGIPTTIPGVGDPHESNNDGNQYWLAFSTPDVGESWARMATTSLPAATLTPLTSYRRIEHKEEAVTFRGSVPFETSDRIVNNNYWDLHTNVTISPLYSPDPAGSDIDIKFSVMGHTTESLTVTFDMETGELPILDLGTYTSVSRNEVSYNTTAPISAINGESTKLSMRGPGFGQWMKVYLNYVELNYDALFQATENHLLFHGSDAPGVQPMVVSGFGKNSLGLIELTDPRQPVFVNLAEENMIVDGNLVSLSIQPEQMDDQRVFFAHGDMLGTGIANFAYWISEVVENPVDPTELSGGDPALVVVTHEEFRDGLDPWIAHRRARAGGPLDVHVVQTQDLYDWYTGGMHDAWAVKRFAAHAINQWGSYALQLVGDGNENMRELGVNAAGQDYSKDWVPTHYHNQGSTGYAPELLGSDKWFATFETSGGFPFDNFPDHVRGPWEILVGRFPCNSSEALANIINKIIAVESPQPEQSWRKRGIFFADDSWSNDWGASGFTYLRYKPSEEDFALSARDSLGSWWGSGTGVAMVADTLDLAIWLDPHWPPGDHSGLRNRQEFEDFTRDEAYPPLLSSLNAGGLVAHFQGHGSGYLLTSEYWFKDQIAGDGVLNVADLSNNNRPWVFFGMGCHIANWCRSTVVYGSFFTEPSLSEKFLVRGNSGASASYASSGYEYISSNLRFGEVIFKKWTLNPPISRGVGGFMNERSRWVLGELLWSAEAEVMTWGAFDTHFREAVAQFILLGDPLMVLDGGEPEVTATLHGTADEIISGSVDLIAMDASNQRLVSIEARDEAGIDRIELFDSDGHDLSTSVVAEILPEGAVSHQVVTYQLELDVLPYEHSITAKVYDTGAALPADRHYELQFDIRQEGEFTSGGEIVDPETFVFREDEPVTFNGIINSAAWLDDSMAITLTGEHLNITNEVFTYDKSNVLSFSFTAEENGESDEARAVVLSIAGYDTRFVLAEGAGTLDKAAITGVYSYPNPLHDSTRFVYESSSAGGTGRVRIFSMSGRQVANLQFTFAGNDGGGVVPWDGQDAQGDALGNGTYLYRIEMETPSGQLVSEMQRLVIMR